MVYLLINIYILKFHKFKLFHLFATFLYITFLLLTFNSIVPSSRKKVFLVLLLFPILIFLFLAIKFDRFIKAKQSRGLVISRLCFFEPKLLNVGFIGSGLLDLHLWESAVGWVIAPETMSIWISNHDARF